jgi:hypothetical protein
MEFADGISGRVAYGKRKADNCTHFPGSFSGRTITEVFLGRRDGTGNRENEAS